MNLNIFWSGVTNTLEEISEEYPVDSCDPSSLIYCMGNGILEQVMIAYPCKATAIQMEIRDLAVMSTRYRLGGQNMSVMAAVINQVVQDVRAGNLKNLLPVC